ncbi:MAG: hypothetical protein PF637_05805 [Spirochaetes bacterium]|jgi:hypothetical protein|nr:hypothetical protein [Spirochaetota bacterium]
MFKRLHLYFSTINNGPYKFITDNGEDYPVNGSESWVRVCDIEVIDGIATLKQPDTTIEPDSSDDSEYEDSDNYDMRRSYNRKK